jgi:D-arabinose 1-dehydrogenase-like Zn-dependent alcohol dehydrogenase
MLAMNYRGPKRVRIDHKPMPEILHPEDAIVRITRSCICGSDLHLYNGSVPDTTVGMTFGFIKHTTDSLGADVCIDAVGPKRLAVRCRPCSAGSC